MKGWKWDTNKYIYTPVDLPDGAKNYSDDMDEVTIYNRHGEIDALKLAVQRSMIVEEMNIKKIKRLKREE